MYHDAPCEPAVVVHRKRTTSSAPHSQHVRERYRLADVIDFLVDAPKPFLKVALQFPDDLLDDAVPIVHELEAMLRADPRTVDMEKRAAAAVAANAADDHGCTDCAAAKAETPGPSRPSAPRPVANTTVLDNPNVPTRLRFTILADNTFGSCCPDEITAQHYANECIVHFGEACLSRTTRIPVFYVLPTFHFHALAQLFHAKGSERMCENVDTNDGRLGTAEASLVAHVVRAQQQALQRHLARWLADNPAAPPLSCELVVVGSSESPELFSRAQAVWGSSTQEDNDGGKAVSVVWCRHRSSSSTISSAQTAAAETGPGHDDGCAEGGCVPPPAAGTTNAAASLASNWPADWTVNGVIFPRFMGGTERAQREAQLGQTAQIHSAVQFFLFVGPSNAPHLVHLMAVQQYNNYHYDDAQRAFVEQVTDAEGGADGGMNIVSMLDETFGECAIRDADLTGCAWADNTESSPHAMAQGLVQRTLGEQSASAASPTPGGDEPLDLKRLFTAACGAAQLLYQRRLRQRDFNIETLRASSAVGILVASLAVEGYYETTMLLHKLLRASGKRSYVMYVGHLNEYKLANFADAVDCFVAIACPNSRESHFPLKADNYLKPIVAPSEVLLAVAARDELSPLYGLPAAYSTAFDYAMGPLAACLEEATRAASAAAAAGTGADAETDWGAVGALVRAGGNSRALMTHDAAVQGSLARMHERSYVGLDPQHGQTAVQSELVDGLHGIASVYADERARQ